MSNKQPKHARETKKISDEKLKTLENGWFYEYKEHVPYWVKQLDRIDLPSKLIYLCGRKVYRFTAVSIEIIDTPDEVKSKVRTGKCFAIKCIKNQRREDDVALA